MLTEEEAARVRESVERVAQRANETIAQADTAWRAVLFIDVLHENLDRVAQQVDATQPAIACKAGCAWCCSRRVEVNEAEALRLAHHLRGLEAGVQRELTARLQHIARLRAVAGTRHVPEPCALLKDNLCSVYAIRPAVCRKGHSLSEQACATRAQTIPQNLTRLLHSEALIAGTHAGYQRNQLRASSHELSAAVLAALGNEHALDDWFSGQPLLGTVAPDSPASSAA